MAVLPIRTYAKTDAWRCLNEPVLYTQANDKAGRI